jgi:4-carboxymuconolactone decarboxylase
MSKWPEDVYPESGFRLPLPKREEMDEYGKTVFDKQTSPESGHFSLQLPTGIHLHSPRLAALQDDLNVYLRFQTGLDPSIRELAILTTAREMDSEFEWAAHIPHALKDGLSPEIIDIVKYGKKLTGLPEMEAVVIQLTRQLVTLRKVSSETYAHAFKIFGSKLLVDLVSLIGLYVMTGLQLFAFDIQLLPVMNSYLPLPPLNRTAEYFNCLHFSP